MRNNYRPTIDAIAERFSEILFIILAVPVYYTFYRMSDFRDIAQFR